MYSTHGVQVKAVDEKSSLSAPLPAELEAVALIDASICAAAGTVSVAWWYGEVRAGRAPAPVMRGSRCTRWRLTDVRDFWRRQAEQSADGAVRAAMVQSRAEKASAKARELRTVAQSALVAAR